MRFLIFNIVVVGALFYLFAGGRLSNDGGNDGVLQRAAAAIETSVRSGRQATAAVIDKVTAKGAQTPLPPNLQTPAIETPTPTVPEIEVPEQKAVPPIPLETAKSKPRLTAPDLNDPTVKDPSVKRRRAEVLAEGPIAGATSEPKFMTSSQRRRELHALSEEMELLFAGTRAR